MFLGKIFQILTQPELLKIDLDSSLTGSEKKFKKFMFLGKIFQILTQPELLKIDLDSSLTGSD